MKKDPRQKTAVGKFVSALVLLSLALTALGPVTALGSAPEARFGFAPGNSIELRAGTINAGTSIRPSADPSLSAIQTADIQVNYTGFSPEAQAAFEYAVTIWESQLTSSVPIVVNASYEDLGDPNILGSAGANVLVWNWGGVEGAPPPPQEDVIYPIALANKLAGVDLISTEADIVARFNNTFPNWYFGTDGNTPQDSFDFASVVLHELGHGLGFAGSARVQNGQGSVGLQTQNDGVLPTIYDTFVENGGGQPILGFPNPSGDLAAQLTGNDLFIDSPTVNAVLGGTNRGRIYAPTTWTQGTSYSHWDEDAFPPGDPNSLMTGFLDMDEAIHDPGPLTRGFFQDQGWSLQNPTAVTVSTYSADASGTMPFALLGVTLLAALGTVAVVLRRKQG